jgi:hypothetical protein
MLHVENMVTNMSLEEFEQATNEKTLAIAGVKLKTIYSNVRQAEKAHLTEDYTPARLGTERPGGHHAGTPPDRNLRQRLTTLDVLKYAST